MNLDFSSVKSIEVRCSKTSVHVFVLMKMNKIKLNSRESINLKGQGGIFNQPFYFNPMISFFHSFLLHY